MVFRMIIILTLWAGCLYGQGSWSARLTLSENLIRISNKSVFISDLPVSHSSALWGGSIGAGYTRAFSSWSWHNEAALVRGGYAFRVFSADGLPTLTRRAPIYSLALSSLAVRPLVSRNGRNVFEGMAGCRASLNILSLWTPDTDVIANNNHNINRMDLAILAGFRYHLPPRKTHRLSLDLRYYHGVTRLLDALYGKTYRRSIEAGLTWEWYKEKKTGKKKR